MVIAMPIMMVELVIMVEMIMVMVVVVEVVMVEVMVVVEVVMVEVVMVMVEVVMPVEVVVVSMVNTMVGVLAIVLERSLKRIKTTPFFWPVFWLLGNGHCQIPSESSQSRASTRVTWSVSL